MLTTTSITELLRGADHVETTPRGILPHRLPEWIAPQCPDPRLLAMERQPSGVRIAMMTAANTVELVTHPTRLAYRGLDRPRGGVDLVVDHRYVLSDQLTGGDTMETDLQTGETTLLDGPSHLTRFSGLGDGEKLIELWLPHNEQVELVELRLDAPVKPAPASGPRWVHYGSSISHGSNAATPARTWVALAAQAGGVELRNLGFGGNALADPFMARLIRDTPADFVSVKLGINIVNSDAMRLRTFIPAVHGFIDTIRDGHPTTPLLLASPIHCEIHEDAPGPGTFDLDSLRSGQIRFTASGQAGDTALGRLTLRVIREALAAIVEGRDDPNLHYLDGTALYGPDDAVQHPLPDALHPDTATHELIGTRFARHAFGAGGPFVG